MDPKTKIPADIKEDEIFEDAEPDPINGRYKGWVYNADLTYRDPYSVLAFAYMTIDDDSINYYKDKS